MNRPAHDLIDIPDGITLGEFLPTFADVKHEVLIGKPNDECASCWKPFNNLRKRRGKIRLYSTSAQVPVVHQFHICGRCCHQYKQGGDAKNGVLVAVQSYFEGRSNERRS